jgi:hypothetical protein
VVKTCKGVTRAGQPCRANPADESEYCAFHDPEHADAVQEGRRVGRQRRKRETTLAAAFDFESLRTIPNIQRLVDVAAFDALALDNNIARVRVLAYLAQTAMKLVEVGEMEERLQAVEAALGPRVVRDARNRR